jgi:ribosomal small subunit protein bTHX
LLVSYAPDSIHKDWSTIPMGRGDRKTRKGKIAIRSYGNARPRKAATKAGGAVKKAVPAKAAVKKAAPAAKKAAPKKPA